MKKYIIPLILILFLSFALIGDCAWLSGWDQRIELAIDNYAGDIGASVTWFPVTVFLTPLQGEEIFTELTTDAEYLKVAFTKSDGTTELYGENELFGGLIHYPPAHTDDYVKSTTKFDTNYWAYHATNPTKLLTGARLGRSWLAANDTTTNQRFHIDLGSAKVMTKIYYENSHDSGVFTNVGVQNFTFWGSNTAESFAELTYAIDTGWTQLTTSQSTFDQHTASDVADPKYITVTNTTAYRYYAFKFADNYGNVSLMGVRHIELQTRSAIYHVSRDGWTIDANTSIYMYYDKDHADNTTYIGAINTVAGAAVWDGNFKAVYHLVDATTSTVKDSTSNNNDGTKKDANEPIEATGKVGKGQDFDGTNDRISIDPVLNDIAASLTGTISFCANIDVDDGNENDIFTISRDADATRTELRIIYDMRTDKDWIAMGVQLDGGAISWKCNTPLDSLDAYVGSWLHVTITHDGTEAKIYFNGVSQDLTWAIDIDRTKWFKAILTDATADSDTCNIGLLRRNSANVVPFDGLVDDNRVSITERSAAWIKGTYNSLWDTLLTYGSEETAEVEANAVWFGANF